MLIVGRNLHSLSEQHDIVDGANCFDEFSLTLHLDDRITQIEPTSDKSPSVVYGEDIPKGWIKTTAIPASGLVLKSKSCLLACSDETVCKPDGYIGFVQAKGTLARLFVQIHCCDGQVEPGYKGKVTFEICNLASFDIRSKPRQPVAQLFLMKTSTKGTKLYNGRYQGADGPTISTPG